MFHVRSASRGTEIKPEFNHPFETEQLVLAHNGTLVPKTELAGYSTKLDSEVFLIELDKVYLTMKNDKNRLVKSLQSTMTEFTGKFAFLIYEKETGQWYAIRGKTADLHIIYLLTQDEKPETLGYIINTVKADLGFSTDHTLELQHLLGKREVPVMSTPIEELKQETIFHLGTTEIEEVGELKQNIAEVVPAPISKYVPGSRWQGHAYGRGWWEGEEDDPLVPNSGVASELTDWLSTYGLEVEDLDTIMFQSLGIPLMCCEEGDIKTLQKFVLAKIQCPKKFRESVIKEMTRLISSKVIDVYTKGGFQFPYMLEERKTEFIKAIQQEIELATKLVQKGD